MILTYILTILLFAYRDSHALPVSCSNATWDGVPAVVDSKAQPSRTLFGVAWGCVLTVFIYAWTSVHPNVPPRGPMGAVLARVKLMFWTIVAPELVLAWASKLWTMVHGHFLEMGGFRLVSNKIHRLEEPEQPGWMSTSADWEPLERFKEVVGDPNYVFPAITPAQIQDRSKGDGLSKLLAIGTRARYACDGELERDNLCILVEQAFGCARARRCVCRGRKTGRGQSESKERC